MRGATASYHGARMLSYSLIGGILGAVGVSAAGLFGANVSRALPWAFALLFVGIAWGVLALGGERKLITRPKDMAMRIDGARRRFERGLGRIRVEHHPVGIHLEGAHRTRAFSWASSRG